MGRIIGAVVAGFAAWFVVSTVAGVPVRAFWPAYVVAIPEYSFTLPMLVLRLVIGGFATVVAGYVAGWIAPRSRAAGILGGVLVVFFLPVHYQLFDKFPLWYHLVFLGALWPLVVVGARLCIRRNEVSTTSN